MIDMIILLLRPSVSRGIRIVYDIYIVYFHVKYTVDFDCLRDIFFKINITAESWNHALTRDGTWHRVIFQNISTAQNLCAYGSPDLKHSLDLDCFETKRNVDDVFYWFHMIIYIYNQTLQILTFQSVNFSECKSAAYFGQYRPLFFT